MVLHCLPEISKSLAWRCHLDGSIQSLHKESTPTLTSTVTHIYLPLIIFECYIVVFQKDNIWFLAALLSQNADANCEKLSTPLLLPVSISHYANQIHDLLN